MIWFLKSMFDWDFSAPLWTVFSYTFAVAWLFVILCRKTSLGLLWGLFFGSIFSHLLGMASFYLADGSFGLVGLFGVTYLGLVLIYRWYDYSDFELRRYY